MLLPVAEATALRPPWATPLHMGRCLPWTRACSRDRAATAATLQLAGMVGRAAMPSLQLACPTMVQGMGRVGVEPTMAKDRGKGRTGTMVAVVVREVRLGVVTRCHVHTHAEAARQTHGYVHVRVLS